MVKPRGNVEGDGTIRNCRDTLKTSENTSCLEVLPEVRASSCHSTKTCLKHQQATTVLKHSRCSCPRQQSRFTLVLLPTSPARQRAAVRGHGSVKTSKRYKRGINGCGSDALKRAQQLYNLGARFPPSISMGADEQMLPPLGRSAGAASQPELISESCSGKILTRNCIVSASPPDQKAT